MLLVEVACMAASRFGKGAERKSVGVCASDTERHFLRLFESDLPSRIMYV
jgi:hypothetical protein